MSERFELKREHILLMRRMCWRWGEGYSGVEVPSVCPKRPYGNSNVLGDVAEILGVGPPDEPWIDGDVWLEHHPGHEKALLEVHGEMKMALEVTISVQSFELGLYVELNDGSWMRAD